MGATAAQNQLDHRGIQHKCTVIVEMNGHFLLLPVYAQQGFQLYEVHQIDKLCGKAEGVS